LKKALVIGSEGQDGKLLVKLLINKGYKVYGVDRSEISFSDDIQYLKIDLGTPSSILKCLSVEYDEIYYLAAFHHSSINKELNETNIIEKSYAVNVLSFALLLESLVSQNAKSKVFYASSSLIFGKSGIEVQNEKTQPKPNCIYSITKQSAMQLAEYYRNKYNLYIAIGIMYNHESVYRGDAFLSKKIINQTKEIVAGKREKIIIGDLKSKTDWGYAPDFVNAMWHVLQLNKGDNYIISSGTLRQVKDWFEVLFNYLGMKWEEYVLEDKSLIFRKKPVLKGDNSKLMGTGWLPKTSFEQMVINIYEGKI